MPNIDWLNVLPGTGGIPVVAAGAAVMPDSGNVSATVRISGAAVAQVGGADKDPTMVARPIPADTAGTAAPPNRTGLLETRRAAADFSAS